MLLSLALIFLLGLLLSGIFIKLKLPGFLGLLLTGILLGNLKLLDQNILAISSELRQIALIIILARAGLSLNISDLKKVGRPAILMCFIPAVFEMIGIILFAPILFSISLLDAAIMGAVLAAVSPAVVVPRMLALMENEIGTNKSIPQLIMAGASVDDIFVIVMFTALLSLANGQSFQIATLLSIPISIFLGIGVGTLVGILLSILFKIKSFRDSIKVVILLGISFLLVSLEKKITISGYIAVMAMGTAILYKNNILAKRLSHKFSKLWVGAEILLFVLVGVNVDISYGLSAGVFSILIIIGGLLFRMLGVLLCLVKTHLNFKERLFCVFSYMPKATVQAAIGSIPLSMGLACGKLVLTVSVMAIMISAPIGAFLIDFTSHKFLNMK